MIYNPICIVVVTVQFHGDIYVVSSEGMVDVSVVINKMVAQPLKVIVLVSTLSSNTTSGQLDNVLDLFPASSCKFALNSASSLKLLPKLHGK